MGGFGSMESVTVGGNVMFEGFGWTVRRVLV